MLALPMFSKYKVTTKGYFYKIYLSRIYRKSTFENPQYSKEYPRIYIIQDSIYQSIYTDTLNKVSF